MEISDYDLINIVFKHYETSIDSTTYSTYMIEHAIINVSIKLSCVKHKSYDNHPTFNASQMMEVFNYVISEMKQHEINIIRNGINDIVLTVESILSNKKYYKHLIHSSVKYGYEFIVDVKVELSNL
jgi:hypothetical protein